MYVVFFILDVQCPNILSKASYAWKNLLKVENIGFVKSLLILCNQDHLLLA